MTFYGYTVEVEVSDSFGSYRETSHNVYPMTKESAERMIRRTLERYAIYCSGKTVNIIKAYIRELEG